MGGTAQGGNRYTNTIPPDSVTTSRWIDVDLAEQTLAVYEIHELIFATVIASGLEPFWTRPGLFQIYQKKKLRTCATTTQQIFTISITSRGRYTSTNHARSVALISGLGLVTLNLTAV